MSPNETLKFPSALFPPAAYDILTTTFSFVFFSNLWLLIVACDPDTAASSPTLTVTDIDSQAALTNEAVVVAGSVAAQYLGADCPSTFAKTIEFKYASYSPSLCT